MVETPKNVYPESVKVSVMGSYREGMSQLGVTYRVRKDRRGRKYPRLLREDGSALGISSPLCLRMPHHQPLVPSREVRAFTWSKRSAMCSG